MKRVFCQSFPKGLSSSGKVARQAHHLSHGADCCSGVVQPEKKDMDSDATEEVDLVMVSIELMLAMPRPSSPTITASVPSKSSSAVGS